MEIDITDFVRTAEPFDFSASRAELGDDAGRITWRNALAEGTDNPLLTTPDQIQALRDWARSSGGWDDEEITAWSDEECNALFIQIISGDLRELESLCTDDGGAIDWAKAEELADRGTIGGNIFPATERRTFYYLGS